MKAHDGIASILLANLMRHAFTAQADIHKRWVDCSHRLCGGDPFVSFDLQRLGRQDAIIRCMEDELATGPDLVVGMSRDLDMPLMTFDLQVALSASWLMSAYETLRLLRERKTQPQEGISAVLDSVALVRMPLVKGAVARTGSKTSPGTPHRPSTGASNIDGSVVWAVTDKQGRLFEVSRRLLSDQYLSLSEQSARDTAAT